MLQKRTVQFVRQHIDGGIHIVFHGFRINILAGQVHLRCRFVLQFIDGQGNGCRQNIIAVAIDALQFFRNARSNRIGNIQM